MMRFSIIIPVYNTEAFLPRCLDSLVAQTDGDFEAVIVDDCSPGAAGSSIPPYQVEEIVKRYDARFRYVRHEKNRSAFQARRTAIAMARGEYVVPVDPDDYLMPDLLSKVRALVEREAPDVISYWMEYDDGQKTYPHWCRHPAVSMPGVEALRELADHRFFTGVASKVFRREVLVEALSVLDAPEDLYINTSDDFLMLVPALLKSKKVSFLDFAGYRYFVNADSTSFSWKTDEGLRRACRQTRLAGDLVVALAERTAEPAAAALVRQLAAGLERWFAQSVAEGPLEQLDGRAAVLLECLHPEHVAREFIGRLGRLRRSRTYRWSEALAGLVRRLRSCRLH